MPPVHAGIVPSLLPAISAPTGVSVVPSFAASAADTFAAAVCADSEAARPIANRTVSFMIASPLEVVAQRQRQIVTIGQIVAAAAAEIGGVAQRARPAVEIDQRDAGDGLLAPGDELAGWQRRLARDVVE